MSPAPHLHFGVLSCVSRVFSPAYAFPKAFSNCEGWGTHCMTSVMSAPTMWARRTCWRIALINNVSFKIKEGDHHVAASPLPFPLLSHDFMPTLQPSVPTSWFSPINRPLLRFLPSSSPTLAVFLLALPPSPPFPFILLFSHSDRPSSTCTQCCFHIKRQQLHPETSCVMCVSIDLFSHITSNFKHKWQSVCWVDHGTTKTVVSATAVKYTIKL